MRWLSTLVFALLALPVLAAGWSHYANARFGYGIDVPPGFSGRGEAANGDGQVFANAAGTQTLAVWGGQAMAPDFAAEAGAAVSAAEAEGWRITYRATLGGWLSFSGLRSGLVLYERVISLCGGNQYAAFRLVYPARDIAATNAVVERLVASLKPAARSTRC
jgi:hypothetical protein